MLTTQSTFMDEVRIRQAELTDADVIYRFMCMLEERHLDLVKFYRIYQLNVNFPTIFYYVAEKKGEVVGFMSCHTQQLLHECGKIAEIQELFVRPDMRGLGIGRQLLAKAANMAKYRRCLNMEVSTNQKRTEAVRFYESQSFQLSHYKLVKSLQS